MGNRVRVGVKLSYKIELYVKEITSVNQISRVKLKGDLTVRKGYSELA